jgi:nucleotide-binding universal stress UspA family protein
MATIVVGVDFTGEAQAALEAGIEEAKRRQGQLLLVHHVRVGIKDDPILEWREKGERLLERAAEVAKAAGVEARTRLDLGTQTAASVILDAAEDPEVELIVIGTRKRSRVGKALMGSDAQLVIIGADVQVLCVKDTAERDGLDV